MKTIELSSAEIDLRSRSIASLFELNIGLLQKEIENTEGFFRVVRVYFVDILM